MDSSVTLVIGFIVTRHDAYICLLIKYIILKLIWKVIKNEKLLPCFSIQPLSKTWYWLGVCHGWCHLQGFARASSKREIQNESSGPDLDLNPVPSAYETDVEKCFVVYYILLTLFSQQTSVLVELQSDANVLSLQYKTKYFSIPTTWCM